MQVDQNKQEHTVIGFITQLCFELGLGSGLSIGEFELCEKLTSLIGSTIISIRMVGTPKQKRKTR